MTHLRILVMTFIAALLFIGDAAVTMTNAATTFNVTDTASLIQAIENANDETNYPGADIIDLGGNTITFSSSYTDSGRALPLITSDITLQNGILDADNNNIGLLITAPDSSLTLENMTLQNAGGEWFDGGAALFSQGNIAIVNTRFENNLAGDRTSRGGAIYNRDGNVTITDSHFTNNVSIDSGGALYVEDSREGTLTISGTTFDSNAISRGAGGAIYIGRIRTPVAITDSQFIGNRTDLAYRSILGAGVSSAISSSATHLIVTQSLFAGNYSARNALILNLGDVTITNSILAGNSTAQFDQDESPMVQATQLLTITNSILWDNQFYVPVDDSFGSVDITYSIIESGYAGTGNLAVDPLFVAPQPASNAPTALGDYRLDYGSPAIDAASNTAATDANIGNTDLADNPRFTDDPFVIDTGEGTAPVIDMGAYEYQSTAIGRDVNGDQIISPVDAVYVINRLGSDDLSADVDGDGDVDTDDLNAVYDALGTTP